MLFIVVIHVSQVECILIWSDLESRFSGVDNYSDT